MPTTLKQSIFSEKIERFNLLLPFAFILFSIIEILTRYQVPASQKYMMVSFAQYVFLNHTHIILTPLMFLFYPEFSFWTKHKDKPFYISKKFFLGIFVVFLATTIITFTYESFPAKIMQVAIISFFSFFGSYHNIFQTYGFFCLYDRKKNLKPSSSSKNYKSLFLVLVVIHALNFIFKFSTSLSIYREYALSILACVGLIVALVIICLTIREPEAKSSNKSLYSIRLLLVALTPVSSVALMGFLALHGIEYLSLFIHMKKTSRPEVKKSAFIFGLITIMCVFSIPGLAVRGHFPIVIPATMLIIFNAYMLSMDMTHYTMDSFLFRFSRAASRDNILPLIIDAQTHEKESQYERAHYFA